MDAVLEGTGVAVVSRGNYVPPEKKLQPGDRRLHLLIEGDSELGVQKVKMEIVRLLDEETLRVSSSMAVPGRYSMM